MAVKWIDNHISTIQQYTNSRNDKKERAERRKEQLNQNEQRELNFTYDTISEELRQRKRRVGDPFGNGHNSTASVIRQPQITIPITPQANRNQRQRTNDSTTANTGTATLAVDDGANDDGGSNSFQLNAPPLPSLNGGTRHSINSQAHVLNRGRQQEQRNTNRIGRVLFGNANHRQPGGVPSTRGIIDITNDEPNLHNQMRHQEQDADATLLAHHAGPVNRIRGEAQHGTVH